MKTQAVLPHAQGAPTSARLAPKIIFALNVRQDSSFFKMVQMLDVIPVLKA